MLLEHAPHLADVRAKIVDSRIWVIVALSGSSHSRDKVLEDAHGCESDLK